jgi:hypothetical protein
LFIKNDLTQRLYQGATHDVDADLLISLEPGAPYFASFAKCGMATECTILVYAGAMATTKRASARQVRRSITLSPKLAKRVETIAKQRALSDNRVLVELIEQGIEAEKQKEKTFFQLAERFRAAKDPEQVKNLGDELGRFVFGE